MFLFLRQNFSKIILIFLLVVLSAGLTAFVLFKFRLVKFEPHYSAVYLETGEVYFGEFSRFPFAQLKNAYVLQRDESGGLNVLPLSATIWQPQGVLKLNSEKIVFTALISKDSLVYKTIAGKIQDADNLENSGAPSDFSPLPEVLPSQSPVMSPEQE